MELGGKKEDKKKGSKDKSDSSGQEGGFDSAKLFVWVKSLESKTNNLNREMNALKNDFIKRQMDLTKEMKTLSDDVLEMKREEDGMSQKLDLIVKELKKTAGIEEVMKIKKYIELWNPLNFVTQRDIEREVEKQMASSKGKLNAKQDNKLDTKLDN